MHVIGPGVDVEFPLEHVTAYFSRASLSASSITVIIYLFGVKSTKFRTNATH